MSTAAGRCPDGRPSARVRPGRWRASVRYRRGDGQAGADTRYPKTCGSERPAGWPPLDPRGERGGSATNTVAALPAGHRWRRSSTPSSPCLAHREPAADAPVRPVSIPRPHPARAECTASAAAAVTLRDRSRRAVMVFPGWVGRGSSCGEAVREEASAAPTARPRMRFPVAWRRWGAGSPKPGSILARRRPGSSHVDMRGLERSSLLPLRAVRSGGRFR